MTCGSANVTLWRRLRITMMTATQTMTITTTPPTTPTATAWTGTDESLPSLTMVSTADNTT